MPKLYKKIIKNLRLERHDLDNQGGMITHLEPDSLECEVKWASGTITMNKVEVTELQLSYFKS